MMTEGFKVPSPSAIAAVLEAAASSTHPAGPSARVAVAALSAAADQLLNFQESVVDDTSVGMNIVNNVSEMEDVVMTPHAVMTREDDECYDVQASLLYNEQLWKPLVFSGFLSSADLGKLLLFTSKRFSKAVVTMDENSTNGNKSSINNNDIGFPKQSSNYNNKKKIIIIIFR